MRALLFSLMLCSGLMASTEMELMLNNQKLADAMNLLQDQISGLMELQKKTAAEVDEKTFNRALSRARSAQWILGLINERKGTLAEGVFTPGELSPGKIGAAAGEEQAALLAKYSEFVSGATQAFSGIESEVTAQSKLKPEERKFDALKAANAKVFTAMSAAHKIFKP